MFSGGKMSASYSCHACGEDYSEVRTVVPWSGGNELPAPSIEGQKWCYNGLHTNTALPADDNRRIDHSIVTLEAGPGLQARLDALDRNVKTLTVVSNGMYDDSHGYRLDRELPQLEELILKDVCWEKVGCVVLAQDPFCRGTP